MSRAQWGNLSGTFVYDGTPPAANPLVVTKDEAVCGKHKLVDEQLVVNPSNKGIANIVVFMYLTRNDPKPAVHPDYAAAAGAEVHMDNQNCRFEPRVALVQTNQTLVVGNKDAVGHNTKIDTLAPENSPINPIIPASSSISQTYAGAERLPVRVSCNIHPWMTGWLVVKDNPYFAVTDANGRFEIPNVPVGKWTFQFWQEKSGYVSAVKVNGKAEQWGKGRQEFVIKPGENDLGTIQVAASLFNK
jgi:hypothetical protein